MTNEQRIKCLNYLNGKEFGLPLSQEEIEKSLRGVKERMKNRCFVCGFSIENTPIRFLRKGNICAKCEAKCNPPKLTKAK